MIRKRHLIIIYLLLVSILAVSEDSKYAQQRGCDAADLICQFNTEKQKDNKILENLNENKKSTDESSTTISELHSEISENVKNLNQAVNTYDCPSLKILLPNNNDKLKQLVKNLKDSYQVIYPNACVGIPNSQIRDCNNIRGLIREAQSDFTNAERFYKNKCP